MAKVKIKAPKSVVTGERITMSRWTGMLTALNRFKLSDEAKKIEAFVRQAKSGKANLVKVELNEERLKDLTSKETADATIDVQGDLSALLQLNRSLRKTMTTLKDSDAELKRTGDLVTGAKDGDPKVLQHAMSELKRLHTAQNRILVVPMMTHKALSKVAESIQDNKADDTKLAEEMKGNVSTEASTDPRNESSKNPDPFNPDFFDQIFNSVNQ